MFVIQIISALEIVFIFAFDFLNHDAHAGEWFAWDQRPFPSNATF